MSKSDKLSSSGKRKTSALALMKIQPKVGTMRRIVLDTIREFGPLTADEITKHGFGPNKHPYTVRPRVTELVDEGWLEPEPETYRTNRGGSPEMVFKLTLLARWRDNTIKSIKKNAAPAVQLVE
tara:strand:+ start:713 stop:1084 length:372 start_codon:yes stop_codon:yes gene_type:complete